MSHERKVWINGKPDSEVSVLDRGFQYGDGLFETIAVVDGQCEFLLQHLDRLQRSCARLGFPALFLEQVTQEIVSFVGDESRAVLKLLLTRGQGGRGYGAPVPSCVDCTRVLLLYPWPDYPSSHWRDGVRIRFCTTPVSSNSALAGMKHLNRLDSVLARSEWQGTDFAEGLLLDGQSIVEGTMTNLFAVRNGMLYTPALECSGVRGIMRQQILAWAALSGIDILETAIHPDWLLQADELFLSNSIIGLWPVRQLNSTFWPVGKITKALMRHLNLQSRGVVLDD